MEWGAKGVYAWARRPQYGTRICLGVETLRAGDANGEARSTVRITEELKARLPGIHAVVTDGVLHHRHIDPLMRQDLLIVNKPTQAPAGRGVTVGKRHEKVHHLETISISRCRHRIFAIGGALYEQRTDDTGTQTYQPIKSYTLRRRRSTYTDWYRSATLECARCGGFKNKTFSLLQTPQDTHAKFLRSEYLRQIAPTDSDFPRIYGFRPNSESANNGTEQAWHLRRIPGYGWDNQALCMLLHASQINSEAWQVHLGRTTDHGVPRDPEDPVDRAA
jgi:hypothetical protein